MVIQMERFESPLFAEAVPEPTKARDLTCNRCAVDHARELIRLWHSRLPKTQRGPWMYAFRAAVDDYSYAVALWNNPSARTLPGHWIELRRMAVAPDAPHCTASWFLGAMAKWFMENASQHEVMISYQDEEVHKEQSTRLQVGRLNTERRLVLETDQSPDPTVEYTV